MTPADQQMDRVAAAQAATWRDNSLSGVVAVVELLSTELDRAHDDTRCVMAQLADLSGRMWQIAAPLRLALDRTDLHELDLRAVIERAVNELNDASGQPIAALRQLDEVRRAER